MICPECRVAGSANRGVELGRPGHATVIKLHGYCRGGCDCQHKAGVWVVTSA